MKHLIRILLGVVLLGAALIYNPSPASADHGEDATDDPCQDPAAGGQPGDDCWHEEEPDIAIAQPEDPCVVTGTVLPGNPSGFDPHVPSIPLVNNTPAHSHFEFINSIIDCPRSDGALAVTAEGGNDGHMIDLLCPPPNSLGLPVPADPTCGDPTAAGWSPLEADLDSDESLAICSTVFPDLCIANPTKTDGGAQHDFNDHHGSVNESGWSHSSDYSDGPGGGESNACDDDTKNNNKADIVVNGNGGWVKYIRIGVVVYAWGCVLGFPATPVFSTVLLILPNLLPIGVPSLFPGSTLNPICPLEFLNHPPFTPPSPGTPASPCGFILAGLAWRGPDWIPPLYIP